MENEKKEPMEIILSKDVNGALVDGYFEDGQAWYTRSQIGEALGYSNPLTAIKNIHQRHKERLDKFSRVAQIELPSGVQEGYVYNVQGVFEICRWSKQPVADAVMDGLYAMAEEVMRKGYYSALPDEVLVQKVVENASDKEKLRSVIIPALRDADVRQGDLVIEYMGLTMDEAASNAKLAKWTMENEQAKFIMRNWTVKYTVEDLPEQYGNRHSRLAAVTKCHKNPKNYGQFAKYCGKVYFNRIGYFAVIDYMVKQGYIDKEKAEEWKHNVKWGK